MPPEQRWDPYDPECPTRRLLDRIGDRWTVLVVGAIADGPQRYSTIAARVRGVSQKMLTQTLRGLGRDGLVHRTVYAEIPPRVEYALTETGLSLQAPLAALDSWAREHMAEVIAARSDYDGAAAG